MGCGVVSRGGDGRVHPEVGKSTAPELANVLPEPCDAMEGWEPSKPSQAPAPVVVVAAEEPEDAAGELRGVRAAAAAVLEAFFAAEEGRTAVAARYAKRNSGKGPPDHSHAVVQPPELLEQVEKAIGPDGAAYVDKELIGSRSMEDWAEALEPMVDWIVAAAAAAPHDGESKRRLRALLAQRLFTTNLTRSNFADLKAKLRAQMLAQGVALKALPADAASVDLSFHLSELAAEGRASRAAQANEGVLPLPPGVDWIDPVAMNERAYIHMLKLVAIAIDDGFQARVGAALRRVFSESFTGHTPAAPKTFARMLGKLISREDHRMEPQRPRPMFNVDIVRAAVAVKRTADVRAALASLAREFGGFAKEKNKYEFPPDELEREFYLRLVLVSMIHEDGRTFGELAQDPTVMSRWEAYAAPGQAHLDGTPEFRRKEHVQRALSWLRAPALAEQKVRMICEVQVMTEATAGVRHGMHELFKVFRAPDSTALFRDLDKAPRKEPQDFWFAARMGELDKVEQFLPDEPNRLNAANSAGTTALYDAAERGHADVVDRLLAAGARANRAAESGGGYAPLQIAAQNGHMGVVDVLLRAGADVAQTNAHGATALHVAAESGYADISGALAVAGAGLDVGGGNRGSTALLMAVEHGHRMVVEKLLEVRASVDLANTDSETPMAVAIYYDRAEIVRLLIGGGANLSLCGQYGTPLEEAETQGRTEIARIIMGEAGA